MPAIDWHHMWTPTLSPLEVATRALIIYSFVQLLFRIVGRKELARYATSELAVIFLIAVALRQSIVGSDESLTSALIAFATILGADSCLSYAMFRSPAAARLVAGRIRPLVRDGIMLHGEMAAARISEEDLYGFLRERGFDDVAEVGVAALERSGRVSVVARRR